MMRDVTVLVGVIIALCFITSSLSLSAKDAGFRMGLGLTSNKKYDCHNVYDNGTLHNKDGPIVISTNGKYDASEMSMSEDMESSGGGGHQHGGANGVGKVHMCLATYNQSLRYAVDATVKFTSDEDLIGTFKEFNGFEYKWEFSGITTTCSNENCPDMAFMNQFICLKKGNANLVIRVLFLDTGERFAFRAVMPCVGAFSYGTEDVTHLLVTLPPFLYLTYLLLKYLGIEFSLIGSRSSHQHQRNTSKRGKWITIQRVLSRNGAQVFFLIFGVSIMIIEYGMAGFHLKNRVPTEIDNANTMHFLFGSFFFLMSSFGFLIQSRLFQKRSFDFSTPILFVYLGAIFLVHEQYSSVEYFIHRVFGILSMSTGILKGVSDVYPQFTFLFLLQAHLTATMLFGASPYFIVSMEMRSMDGANYTFMIVNLTFLWCGMICLLALFLHKRNIRNKYVNVTNGFFSKGHHVDVSDLELADNFNK